jgi:hypothetical protein
MQKTNVNRNDERSMNCLGRSHQRCNSQAAAFLLSNDAEQIHGAYLDIGAFAMHGEPVPAKRS